VLPTALAQEVGAVLAGAAIAHRSHGEEGVMEAATAAAADPQALALVGPYRSAEVAEAVEATAPQGLPLLAPTATWAGVTRHDEPGCDDPARHRGTVLRLPARDTEVAARVAADVRAAGRRALVVVGDHDYGRQLDGQLRLGELPRADSAAEADLVVLAGLAGEPECTRADALGLPVIAFDGVQGAALAGDVVVALPFAPVDGVPAAALHAGVPNAARAAELVAAAVLQGARTRPTLLAALRALGPFDAHGDPVDPAVWLWRSDVDWRLTPERSLPAAR